MDLLEEFPSTEAEFRGRFADEEQCRAHLAGLRWPGQFLLRTLRREDGLFPAVEASGLTNAPAVATRSR